MAATDVYVSDVVHALGERKAHVADSAAAGLLLSSADDLMEAGFRWHHRCGPETGAYDLAVAAVRQLAEGPLDGGVDAIVYATCLPVNGNAGDPAAFVRSRDVKHLMDFPVSRLQADFGLDRAVAFGLNQQACTALLGSVRLAGALLGAEPAWERVLCVTADRFPEGAVYEQAYNLISDGAAACLVSRTPSGPAPLRLVTAHQITNGGLADASDDQTAGSFFSYTARLVRETLDRAGLGPADIAWVVPQNTHRQAWEILARLLGMDAGRVWMPSLPDAGHLIAADNFVNLAALLESGRLVPGDRVLLPMAGFGLNWQALVLEAVAPGPAAPEPGPAAYEAAAPEAAAPEAEEADAR